MKARRGVPKHALFHLSFVFLLYVSLSGCASFKPLALTEETKDVNLEKQSIAVFTVRTSNQYKWSYQPNVYFVDVVNRDGAEKKHVRFGQMASSLTPYASEENQFNQYLMSMDLPAGKYRITYISGFSGVFPVRGNFAIPVFSDFEIGANTIVYLGRIEATLRKKKDDSEMPGGGLFPLIDQATTGFHSGTFDITISDSFEADNAQLKKMFPLVNKIVVQKAVLAPWKKPSKEELDNN